MPELPAVTSSPIAFTSDQGQYFQVPLNGVYFDAAGALKADRWPLYGTHRTIVDARLKELHQTGVLVPGPEPPRKPAFKVTATTPGATGVLITIEITNVTPNANAPPASTADVKVTETNTYPALAVDKVAETIGTSANGGKRPGLVFMSSAPPAALPAAGVYPMTAANPGNPATKAIPKDGGGGNAFTVETRAGGPDATAVAIEIKNVMPAQNTFTLIAKWEKAAPAVAMTGLGGAFGYVIDVAAPDGGFRAPGAGTTTLGGGSDALAVNAVKSSAVILTP